MTAPVKTEPRRQVSKCSTCGESLRSLLAACPKPDCLARQLADELRWERSSN